MLHKLKHAFIPFAHNSYRPHAFRHKWLSIYTIGLIISQFAFGLAFYTGPSNADEAALTKSVLNLTNNSRSSQGLKGLGENKALQNAAYAKLTDMFQKNYWDHVSPSGTEAWYFIDQQGYEYVCAGENLAKGFNTASNVFNAWMASPTHRANIMDKRHSEIGVAVGTGDLDGKSTTIVVQLFGTQKVHAEPTKEIAKEAPATPKVEPVQEVQQQPVAPVTLGEKTTVPTLSLYNATSATKLPYLALWAFILVLVFFDFSMLKKAGTHKLHPHRFHFRSALTLSIFFFILLAIGTASIA